MLILGGKRVCGKTTELIKISSTNKTPIIVLNIRRKQEIEHIAKRKGIRIPEPIILDRYITGRMDGIRINEILIDDIEDILSSIFRCSKIVAMSTSASFMPLEIKKEEAWKIN